MVEVLVLPPRGASSATTSISVSLSSTYQSVADDQRSSSGCSIANDLSLERRRIAARERSTSAVVTAAGKASSARPPRAIGGARIGAREKPHQRDRHVAVDPGSGHAFAWNLSDGRRVSTSSTSAQRWPDVASSLLTAFVTRWGPREEEDAAQSRAWSCLSLHRHRQNRRVRGPLGVQAEYGASGRGGGWSGEGVGDGGARFHDSIIVQKEAEQIFNDFRLLSGMQPKFFNFDLEGKRIFVDRMEDFLERLRIFTMRYRLSSDPEAREVLRRLDAQLLEGGLTMDTMYTQLKKTVDLMRAELDHEQKLGPSGAAELTMARAAMDNASRDTINPLTGMRNLASLLDDPEVIEALSETEVLAAVQEVMRNPSAVSKYASNQKISTLLLKIFTRTAGDS